MSRPLPVAIVFALGLVLAVVRAEVPPPAVAKSAAPTAQAGEWPRIEAVLPAAAGADRPLLIEFFKPDCVYCTQLHQKIWRDEAVAKLLDRTTKTRVDISTPAGATLAERMKLTLFPTVLLVDLTGRVLDRLDGLPSVAAARTLLENAEVRRFRLADDPMAWLELGDFAASAGVPKLAEETYRRVLEDPRTSAEYANSARLKRGRALERLGDLDGAARTLETFAAVELPGSGSLRPGLDLLIRVRKAMGDREGEARARTAFTRLFPELHPPD